MPSFVIGTKFTAKDNVTKAFGNMTKASDKFGRSSTKTFRNASKASSRFGDIFKGIIAANLFQRAVQQVKAGIGGIIGEASKLENAVTDFTTLTGSAIIAAKTVDKLRVVAAKTPFEFGNLATATKTLLGFEAVALKDVIPTLRMLGDTAGGNAERFDRIVLAFSQIQAGGKASMQDINQLINAGVPILGAMAREYGVTVAQMRKMVSEGKATGTVVSAAFKKMTSKGGKFFKGMERASLTFSGRMSTLRDNIKIAAATIGTALLPQIKLLVDQLIIVAQKVNRWSQANQDVIKQKIVIFINRMKTAFNTAVPIIKASWSIMKSVASVINNLSGLFVPFLAAWGTYIALTKAWIAIESIVAFFAFAKALKAAAVGMGILNAVMMLNPVGLIIAGISVLVGLAALLILKWKPVKEFFSGFFDKVRAGVGAIQRFRQLGVGGGAALPPEVTAPNATSAQAQQVGFQGLLQVSGAPPGSELTGETTGASENVALELLGINP